MKEYQKEQISSEVNRINRNLLLPDIQRPFVWEQEQIYKLFDSLMRGYPINTFLYWRLTRDEIDQVEIVTKSKIKMYRFVQTNGVDNEEELNRDRDNYDLVLDGQQRLTSLYIALKGFWKFTYRKKEYIQELYFDVLTGDDENEDGIQYVFKFIDKNTGILKHEISIDENERKHDSLWLNVKRIYEKDIGKADKRRSFVDDIIAANKELEQYKGKIDDNLDLFNDVLKEDGVINYFPENEQSYEKVLDIFVRTNSGGTKLGYSDLLFSKIKLRWIDARDKFKELTDSINKKNIEFDTDFILKACLTIFSQKAEDVRYSITNLHDKLIDNIMTNWEMICDSVKLAINLLDSYLITDKKLLPSFNALIPIIYWEYKQKRKKYSDEFNDDHQEKLIIRTWLIKALLSGAFGGQSDSVLYKCKEAIDKNTLPTNKFPAQAIQDAIKTMKNRSMDLSEERYDQYCYRSKESHLFLSICYKMSINFQPTLKGNLPEQDHIFSKDELSSAEVPIEKINSIYNIRFITGDDNRKKLNSPYTEWLNDICSNKDAVFDRHFIPLKEDKTEWDVSSFDDFLKERKKLMMEKLQYEIPQPLKKKFS